MGLTIKGQCIPDVTEPMDGRRAAGFSETRPPELRPRRCREGLRAGGSVRSGTGGGGEAQPLQGNRPPGQGGPQLALGDLNIPAPRVASGARSPPSHGDVTCLKAVSSAAAWLGRRMDVVGACQSKCMCVINVHSA